MQPTIPTSMPTFRTTAPITKPKATKQLTLIPREQMDKYRKSGTVQLPLFD